MSDSVLYLTKVVSNLQENLTYNWNNNGKSAGNLHSPQEMNHEDDIINLVNDFPASPNEVRVLSSKGGGDAATDDGLVAINKQFENHELSYAKVVASKPALNSTNENVIKPQQSGDIMKNNKISADDFIGVKRRRNRTKRIFLSGIANTVNEEHIQSYLEQRNIKSTYILVFPSKRKGTKSAKVHIPSVDLPLVQGDNFWPRYVTCKLWKSKESLGINEPKPQKTPHGGDLLTYV